LVRGSLRTGGIVSEQFSEGWELVLTLITADNKLAMHSSRIVWLLALVIAGGSITSLAVDALDEVVDGHIGWGGADDMPK
jgi:hypothetical protein